jgi:hypothetical protein
VQDDRVPLKAVEQSHGNVNDGNADGPRPAAYEPKQSATFGQVRRWRWRLVRRMRVRSERRAWRIKPFDLFELRVSRVPAFLDMTTQRTPR